MIKLVWLFLALGVILPQAAWANRAEIMLFPTRIVIEKKDSYATVIIRNAGNATGMFSVDVVDMAMQEDGRVTPLEEGKADSYSAAPYLIIAPRRVTLKPGEGQSIRVMLRKAAKMAPGEYRSHLRLKIDNDDVEGSSGEKKPPPGAVEVSTKVNMVMIIPVIIRIGETTLSMKIESPKVIRDAKGKTMIVMNLLRDGNRSSMGDFTFTYTAPGGKPQVIKSYPGIPVYRPTSLRRVVIPLNDIPPRIDLTKGKLDIVYTAQENEGKKKLAEAQINLSAQ